MSFMERVFYVVGVLLVCWGLVFVAGAVLGMLNPTSEVSHTSYLFAMTLLGIAPGIGGFFLCRKMKRQGRRRQEEVRERTMLFLAKKNEGRLTVAEVAMNMSISSTEAKELLDRCHLDGLANIDVSDSGSVVYLFNLS